MSLQISIEAFLDDAPARAQQAELELKNEKIKEAIEENEKRTKEAFNKAMAAMRSGYMVISGITQAMGGTMSQAFSAAYGITMGAIGTYQAIHTALLASPDPTGVTQIRAAMVLAGLIASIVQLGFVSAGMEDFASQIGGLNMTIQGIGGMLNSMNFG